MKEMATGEVLVLLEALSNPPAPGAMHARTRVPTGYVPTPLPTKEEGSFTT